MYTYQGSVYCSTHMERNAMVTVYSVGWTKFKSEWMFASCIQSLAVTWLRMTERIQLRH